MARSPSRWRMAGVCAKLPYEVDPPKGSSRRKGDPVCCRRRERSSRTSSRREGRSRSLEPRSQRPEARNRLPEKHTKKYDNQDAKDEATPTGTAGVIVLGGAAGRDRPRRSQLDGARGAMKGPAGLRGPKGDPSPAARQGSTALAGPPGPNLTLRVVAEPLTAVCDVSEIMVSAYCADGLGTLTHTGNDGAACEGEASAQRSRRGGTPYETRILSEILGGGAPAFPVLEYGP
jgi:hypothetical protein